MEVKTETWIMMFRQFMIVVLVDMNVKTKCSYFTPWNYVNDFMHHVQYFQKQDRAFVFIFQYASTILILSLSCNPLLYIIVFVPMEDIVHVEVMCVSDMFRPH